jgi:hypothetical protein
MKAVRVTDTLVGLANGLQCHSQIEKSGDNPSCCSGIAVRADRGACANLRHIAAIDGGRAASIVEPGPEVERQTLDRMLKDASWARRAVAAVRLERYGCQPSCDMLISLLDDKSWQVRSFAVRSLARRRIPQQESWFADERDPRVLRAALRHRYQLPSDRIDRAVRMLSRSNDLEDRMLSVEIGAAASDQDLTKLSLETAKQIILRMSRSEAGSLSPRLALVLKQPVMRRPYDWQHWLLKVGRSMQLYPAFSIDDSGGTIEPSLLARLEPDQFAGLEDYMSKLSQRELDLAICLDCTASMSGEIGAAQGGIDDMMVLRRRCRRVRARRTGRVSR